MAVAVSRPLRGTRIDSFYPTVPNPSLSAIDSAFQIQEYVALLVRANPHDVERIVSIPKGTRQGDDAKGKRKAQDEDKDETVDENCWIYEQLRRLAADLNTPLITTLQAECTRATCPEMKAGEWLYLCVAHGNGSTLESCCAIDYILHTLDSATTLLNSTKAFPSRLSMPETSRRHFVSLARRLGRIFAHAYFSHREAFEQAEAESSLYTRYLALTSKFDLVSPDFLNIPVPGGAAPTSTGLAPAATARDGDSPRMGGRARTGTMVFADGLILPGNEDGEAMRRYSPPVENPSAAENPFADSQAAVEPEEQSDIATDPHSVTENKAEDTVEDTIAQEVDELERNSEDITASSPNAPSSSSPTETWVTGDDGLAEETTLDSETTSEISTSSPSSESSHTAPHVHATISIPPAEEENSGDPDDLSDVSSELDESVSDVSELSKEVADLQIDEMKEKYDIPPEPPAEEVLETAKAEAQPSSVPSTPSDPSAPVEESSIPPETTSAALKDKVDEEKGSLPPASQPEVALPSTEPTTETASANDSKHGTKTVESGESPEAHELVPLPTEPELESLTVPSIKQQDFAQTVATVTESGEHTTAQQAEDEPLSPTSDADRTREEDLEDVENIIGH